MRFGPNSLIRWTAAIVIAALAGHGLSEAAEATAGKVIIEISAPESSDVFGCRMPVTIRHSGNPPLTWINAIAKVYMDGEFLASSGIDTADRSLIPEESGSGTRYVAVPVQFDLSPEICRKMTGFGITLARCSFNDKPAEDCLDRIELSTPEDSKIDFFIGERRGENTGDK